MPYGPWFEKHKLSESELDRQRKHTFSKNPVFSVVVPAYKTPVLFLEQMIDSVRSQTYPHWELCIANASPEDQEMAAVLERYSTSDRRIKVKNLDENLGIAENTNEAFSMASGEFVGLLDHDDLLAPQALYRMAEAFNKNDTYDVFYTDEDKVTTDLSEHFQPHFKPDFNLDLLRSNNYITHFFVVRTSLVKKVGGFRKEYDGAQDYDFIFRCVERAQEICHIPEVLYHWRTRTWKGGWKSWSRRQWS